jgi:hypothetical protein
MTCASLVAPYGNYSQRCVTEVNYNAARILQGLKAHGYPGGYEMAKLAVCPLRTERDRLAAAAWR